MKKAWLAVLTFTAIGVTSGIGVAGASPGIGPDEPALEPHLYIGSLAGGRKVEEDKTDQSTPFGVSYTATESYQGQADFEIKMVNGDAVSIQGHGDYTDARAQLAGTMQGNPDHRDQNNKPAPLSSVSIDCGSIPITTTPFTVGGSAFDTVGRLTLDLALEGASESNPQVDCMPGTPLKNPTWPQDPGWYPHFYAYAATTEGLADSLNTVMAAIFDHPGPLSAHLHNSQTSGDSSDQTTTTDDWDITMVEIDVPGTVPGHEPPPSGPPPVGCTITGTNGNDTLIGTPGPDVICGLGGNDVIKGEGGNDIIIGGPGNDTIYGGPGNDTIYGGLGNDRIIGGPGRDSLFGDAGNDELLAKDGARDLVDGGPGRDTATYDRGKDKLRSIEHRRD